MYIELSLFNQLLLSVKFSIGSQYTFEMYDMVYGARQMIETKIQIAKKEKNSFFCWTINSNVKMKKKTCENCDWIEITWRRALFWDAQVTWSIDVNTDSLHIYCSYSLRMETPEKNKQQLRMKIWKKVCCAWNSSSVFFLVYFLFEYINEYDKQAWKIFNQILHTIIITKCFKWLRVLTIRVGGFNKMMYFFLTINKQLGWNLRVKEGAKDWITQKKKKANEKETVRVDQWTTWTPIAHPNVIVIKTCVMANVSEI